MVHRDFPAIGPLVAPELTRTTQDTGPGLDLDQEEAPAADDEEIYFVDGAVLGDELDIGPGPVGLEIGQARSDEREGVALVRPWGGPLSPKWWFHLIYTSGQR